MRAAPALHPALCFLLLAVAAIPAARADATSGHAFEFLRLAAEPVGRALSGAHLASVDGPASLAWNPAGLGETAPSAVILSHATWTAGTAWEWGALNLRRGSGSLGLGCGVLRSGSLEGYDSDGRSTGEFTPQQAYVTIGYGRALGPVVSAGVTAEGILAGDGVAPSDRAWALGGGVVVHLGRADLALAALHWAPALERDGESYPLPGTVGAGASVALPGHTRLHAAAEYLSGGGASARFGAEWRATDAIAALGGATLSGLGETAELQPTTGLAIDLGRVRFAYAYQPHTSIEAVHQLALTALLGSTR
jgi:hypothetical protein